eukprot:358298-Chlamydomonas_euryale.AAC.5
MKPTCGMRLRRRVVCGRYALEATCGMQAMCGMRLKISAQPVKDLESMSAGRELQPTTTRAIKKMASARLNGRSDA